MALLGNSITVRVQQHSSGVANEVIAESTSVDAQFNAEALESTSQTDGVNAAFEGGKNTIQVSGDYLLATDAEQFDLLFVHANAGDKVEVQIYRGEDLVKQGEGVFTSLNTSGALSDSLATGAYSMELDADVISYGPVMNVSNCVNDTYDTFANGTPTGFDAIWSTSGNQYAGTADELEVVDGEVYLVEFDMVLNSGTAPFVTISTTFSSNIVDEGIIRATAGSNVFEWTINATTTALFYALNQVAGDFEITNLSIRHKL